MLEVSVLIQELEKLKPAEEVQMSKIHFTKIRCSECGDLIGWSGDGCPMGYIVCDCCKDKLESEEEDNDSDS